MAPQRAPHGRKKAGDAALKEVPGGGSLFLVGIVEIIKIGDSDPAPLPKGGRPLSGIRALDLTRILAGPMAARTLAEHGADVLMVTAERLPQIPEHVLDTNHGKRSCFLDLAQSEDASRLKALVKGADVFSKGYRPGMISKLGFGRLPGDIVIERENFRLYIPLATSIIVSAILCLLLWLLNR